MKIIKSKLTRRVLILGFSLAIVVIGISLLNKSGYNVTGIPGIFLTNKFCDDPDSPDQKGCTKFITNAMAAGPIYQDIQSDVVISGKLGVGPVTPYNLVTLSNTANSSTNLTIDSQGAQGNQAANINLLTRGNDTAAFNANTKGWHFTARGNAFVTTAEQNDLGLYFWNGSGWSLVQYWDNTGKIGIGTANPAVKLDVAGGDINIDANKTIYSRGRMHIFGEEILYLLNKGGVIVSKAWCNPLIEDCSTAGNLTVEGSKNFEIDHPTKKGYRLTHSSLEGPEVGVYYRGEGKLVNGQAVVNLPDYFEALTSTEGRTVQLTAKGSQPFMLSASEVVNGKFTVYGTKSDGQFYWEVRAVRKDIPPLVVEKPAE